MTFLCPICNEVSSGKNKKVLTKKKGKTWRERKAERSKMATVNLGFTCPCCKETREIGHHNPFEAFKNMGAKKRVDLIKPKKPKILLKPRSYPNQPKELTALSAESLSESIGYDVDDHDNISKLRLHEKKSATVSWDDGVEVRRLILKEMIYQAATRPAITLQCFFRCCKARMRVKKIREVSQRRKNKLAR